MAYQVVETNQWGDVVWLVEVVPEEGQLAPAKPVISTHLFKEQAIAACDKLTSPPVIYRKVVYPIPTEES